jgi:hypothetical protein
MAQGDRTRCSVSGQSENSSSEGVTTIFVRGAINRWWSGLGVLSCTFEILRHTLS